MTSFGKRGTKQEKPAKQKAAGKPAWVYGLLLAGAALLVAAAMRPSNTVVNFACESGVSANGAVVGVRGSDGHELRETPEGARIVNEKATKVLGETHYHLIDNSTMVQLQCVNGNWVRVQITDPEWLKFVRGWVKRAALDEQQSPDGFRTFTDEHFHWDKDTAKEKDGIIRAVNRLHRKDPRCAKAIVPPSVAKSATESSRRGVPVYFINCDGSDGRINVYFVAE